MPRLRFFNDHVADPDAVVARLRPFEIVCVMRERTPMTCAIIERLPNLRLIASTGPGNASIDLAAAAERGVQVFHTGYWSLPTVELTWALILADARHLVTETAALRSGGWQQTVGEDLEETQAEQDTKADIAARSRQAACTKSAATATSVARQPADRTYRRTCALRM